MNTRELAPSLDTLFAELVEGSSPTGAFMLNPGDPGLLTSLERLSAEQASARPDGGASIAAHVDHVRYGLSLLNRWVSGENPFADVDWEASWRRSMVSPEEWDRLRGDLAEQTRRWRTALSKPREVELVELNGMIASIAHLAYHLGAMRQIDRAARGPSAEESSTEGQ